MAIQRSPRYPGLSLPEAISAVDKIYQEEGRSGVSAEVAMQHMGFKGRSGASLKVLSALRKYGLVDDIGFNEVKTSQRAVTILANKGIEQSQDRDCAVLDALFSVDLFAYLYDKVGQSPSEKNLAAQLETQGFTKDGALKAARSYRASMEYASPYLAKREFAAHTPDASHLGQDSIARGQPTIPSYAVEAASNAGQSSPTKPAPELRENERELISGLLSRDASFRILVKGTIGPSEIDRLIQKLTIDREILADHFDGFDDKSAN